MNNALAGVMFRPFIRDPLWANIALKEFGFILELLNKSHMVYSIVKWPNYLFPNADVKSYVHEDSLHLLSPKLGDVYCWRVYAGKPYESEGLARIKTKEQADRVLESIWNDDTGMTSFPRILERDGKPFPPIEWEELIHTDETNP